MFPKTNEILKEIFTEMVDQLRYNAYEDDRLSSIFVHSFPLSSPKKLTIIIDNKTSAIQYFDIFSLKSKCKAEDEKHLPTYKKNISYGDCLMV